MLPVDTLPSGIVTVTLTPNPSKPRGGVVVLDSWLISEISATMRNVALRSPKGVILRSASERVFVAGADLAEIDALDDTALDAYLRAGSEAFSWFSRVPCPTVALVHRTALGGGLELAMHCDAIVAVMPAAGEKPWMIGLPECGLAICPGWGGTQMLPARIDPELGVVRTATGQPFPITEAPAGLIDAHADSIDAAIAAAIAWIGAHPRSESRATPTCIGPAVAPKVHAVLGRAHAAVPASEPATAVFGCVCIGLERGWEAALAEERRQLVRLRGLPAAREKLAAFLKR
jgi:3-hydroxyacyl-CoA dehydrogenase/enoyl-CoA hydratase/3-hydroxybutyryl-CoA epimerase